MHAQKSSTRLGWKNLFVLLLTGLVVSAGGLVVIYGIEFWSWATIVGDFIDRFLGVLTRTELWLIIISLAVTGAGVAWTAVVVFEMASKVSSIVRRAIK